MNNRHYAMIVLFLIGLITIGSAFTGGAEAATLTVNASGGAMYTKIQDAIDNASTGDTILVYSGTYYENVNVNKRLTLRGIGMPVVDAGGIASAITLSAGNIMLEDFVATNAAPLQTNAGIEVNTNNNIIENNTASNNGYSGILLLSSSNNSLSNNNAQNNNYGINNYGILLLFSSNNSLSGNNAKNNSNSGIELYYSSNNSMSGNIASNNYYGISLFTSSNNSMSENNVSNNIYGIILSSCGNNKLTGNNAQNNVNGISLFTSSNNTFSGNNAQTNSIGILLLSSSNNNKLNLNIASNNSVGIDLEFSGNNTIYNNYFNNYEYRFFGTIYTNNWNITKTPGKNIVGGNYLGGNYWANPSGTGFSQTCADNESDGICDSPYVLDSDNIDYLPLVLTNTPAGGVSLTVDNTTKTTTTNTPATYFINLTNTGSIADTFDLTIQHLQNATVTLNMILGKTSFTLGPGTYATGLLNVTGTLPGIFTVNVTATSQTDPAVNATVTTVTTVMLPIETKVVCPSGCAYSSIQAAIDAAGARATILVYSGTYYENVNVTKQLVLKGIDNGGGMPVVDAGGNGSALTLSAGNSMLVGFIATKSNISWPNAGIKLISNNNIVKNNTASDNTFGILLSSSSNNTLSSNTATNNDYGIWLESSSNNNTISSNNASNNSGDGIILSLSVNNSITNNTISLNKLYGIELAFFGDPTSNKIYHNNFINNTYQAADFNSTANFWDSGYPEGGNFWSDYNGTDANNDGIGDTPYNIRGRAGAQDRYPFTMVNGWQIIPLPGMNLRPTDPDHDGIYEDLNGNGRKDFNDVVLFFNNLEWIPGNEPVAMFDFNGNERIDFADIVRLFEEI